MNDVVISTNLVIPNDFMIFLCVLLVGGVALIYGSLFFREARDNEERFKSVIVILFAILVPLLVFLCVPKPYRMYYAEIDGEKIQISQSEYETIHKIKEVYKSQKQIDAEQKLEDLIKSHTN